MLSRLSSRRSVSALQRTRKVLNRRRQQQQVRFHGCVFRLVDDFHNGTSSSPSFNTYQRKPLSFHRHHPARTSTFSTTLTRHLASTAVPDNHNDDENNNNGNDVVEHHHHHQDNNNNKDEVEVDETEQYSRIDQLEHVLLRPGMYVGPNERLPPQPCWVLDPPPPPPTMELLENPSLVQQQQSTTTTTTTTIPFQMTRKDCGIVPALVKIFDEILVNASDNRLRHPKTCTRIDVLIDPGCHTSDDDHHRPPFIRIWNDGKGIPVMKHKKEKMYVPELLFGHLLTGSNFNDDEKRLTGGRHGYGAKLTNIFSTQFTVETVDTKRRLWYQQVWRNNMKTTSLPRIETLDDNNMAIQDYTCVSFSPDIARLTGDRTGTNTIDPADYALMCKRVMDIAGCAAGKLHVTLNGIDLTLSSFADYVQLYRKKKQQQQQQQTEDDNSSSSSSHGAGGAVCYHSINSRWSVGIGLSESGSFESVSFVNGMATPRGGTHVNALVQQVTKKIQERVEKLDPELSKLVSQGLIRRHLFVACDTLIENPTFDSQMKEYLTSSPSNFGSSYTLSQKFLQELVTPIEEGGPGIVEDVLRVAQGRQQASLMQAVTGKNGKRSRNSLLSIPKLDDAHQAGTESGWDCTLILTEGDSAKALAVAGLEVIGRERFGVFPLRGKFLNVRDASLTQLTKNEEVKSLCAILGLDFEKTYDTVEERRELRYGRVMLMTDQDQDGSHIKGLVINFFRHFWPALLLPPVDQSPDDAVENPPFLSSFVTPLLKVSRKGTKEELSFYSMAEYSAWRNSIDPDELKKYRIKYYKGLGTSTPAEAKGYFASFDDHLRPFRWKSGADGEMLDMVFDKKRAADRREWILDEYDEAATVVVNPAEGNSLSYEDFVNKELIHFSHADNLRSIPSVIDGLKPSQRKVLYACFKRKLKNEMKVAQLAGYCAEQTAYHHGEASLQATIIGMAQDFVGSNNINLLVPSGQFGTRLTGGADAASPRYIFTYLSPIARNLFPEADDVLLAYREDDGQKIEPEYFCPVIPLLLVNGTMGIGTGWSTSIPSHCPFSVLAYIRARLDGAERPPIQPFARGFNGEINETESGYVSIGKAHKKNANTVLIDELPLKCWTTPYKAQLLKLREKGTISGFIENHTTAKVSFTVNMKAAQLKRLEQTGFEKAFKLISSLPTTNMHAFDAKGQMLKFDSAESIADCFFPIRLALYQDRKSVMQSELNYSATMLKNRARFIESVIKGDIGLTTGRKTKGQLSEDLSSLGFLTASELRKIREDNALMRRGDLGLDGTDENDDSNDGDFDYLLNMPLSSLTAEKIEDLRTDATKKEESLEDLRNTSPEDMWRQDLDRLEKTLKSFF